MKLTLLFILLHILNVSAGIYSQTTRLSLTLNSATVEEVLKYIEKQSEFRFLYNNYLIDVNRKVDVNFKNQTIEEILKNLFKGTNVAFRVIDRQIVLSPNSSSVNEILPPSIEDHLASTSLMPIIGTILLDSPLQVVKVSGIVLDAKSGAPLPGVNVVIDGTTNGTISDLDGKFLLEVPNTNVVLVFSFIGYTSQKVQLNGKTDLTVQLAEDTKNLEEVVVIGYGTQKKSDLTGAITSVKSDVIKDLPVIGVDQALQGKAAGVQVTQNTGAPGSNVSVRIRGTGTLNNSDPLYVVDGVPITGNINYLNPSDIESMDILKDASATAIYGARAANGVILISTKKGKSGQKGVFTVDAYKGVLTAWKKADLMSADEFIEIRNKAGYPIEDPKSIPDSMKTDWQNEVLRQGIVENYQVSFLGGSERSTYAISGGYQKTDGIIKGSDYERISFRVNTDNKISDRLTIGENLGYAYSIRNVIPENNEWTSPMITTLTIDPAISVYSPITEWQPSIRNNVGNPIGILERNHNTQKISQLVGNFYGDLDIFKFLKFRSTFGIEMTNTQIRVFNPIFYMTVAEVNPVSTLQRTDREQKNWLWENTLTFNKKFDKHDLTLLAGVTSQDTKYEDMYVQKNDVPNEPEDLWYISAAPASSERVVTGTAWEYTFFSYLGRMIYNYDNKYLLTASFRRDGCSRFGTKNRFGNFPSVSIGWKLTEEPFMKGVPYINNLKLRAGWGEIGNAEMDNYGSYTTVDGKYNYVLGLSPSTAKQTMVSGASPRTVANDEIKWETTKQTNVGIDLGLFDEKISLTGDYFIKETSDMLLQVPIPMYSGVEINPWGNAGSISNKGFEMSLSYRKMDGIFKYEIGCNITSVKNNIESLGANGKAIPGAQYRASNFVTNSAVGHPIAAFYGYQIEKIFQNQEEIDQANLDAAPKKFYQTKVTAPGDYKFKDLNGDRIIDQNDRTYIGSPHPDLVYGLNANLSFREFDLSVSGQGTKGNDIFQAYIYYTEGTGYWNMTKNMKDSWTPENTGASLPRIDQNNANDNLRISDRYVKDGSYFRIKNVVLGYNLPKFLCDYIHVSKLRVYASGQNLLTFTKYPGLDPEIGQGATPLDIAVDRGTYPQARTIMFGLNLTF